MPFEEISDDLWTDRAPMRPTRRALEGEWPVADWAFAVADGWEDFSEPPLEEGRTRVTESDVRRARELEEAGNPRRKPKAKKKRKKMTRQQRINRGWEQDWSTPGPDDFVVPPPPPPPTTPPPPYEVRWAAHAVDPKCGCRKCRLARPRRLPPPAAKVHSQAGPFVSGRKQPAHVESAKLSLEEWLESR